MIPIRSGGVDPVPHLTTHQLEIKTKPSRKTLSESARLQTPSLRSLGCKEAWLDTRIRGLPSGHMLRCLYTSTTWRINQMCRCFCCFYYVVVYLKARKAITFWIAVWSQDRVSFDFFVSFSQLRCFTAELLQLWFFILGRIKGFPYTGTEVRS